MKTTKRLDKTGLDYNHIISTCEYYRQIITTRTYEHRPAISNVQSAGMRFVVGYCWHREKESDRIDFFENLGKLGPTRIRTNKYACKSKRTPLADSRWPAKSS